jgi:phosphoglycolate phosphatase
MTSGAVGIGSVVVADTEIKTSKFAIFSRSPLLIVPSVNRFRTVLFDLDGTLLDHFAAIHRSHVHTMRTLGLPEPTMEQVHRAVGGGLEVAISRLLGEKQAALLEKAVPIYRKFWDENMLLGVALLPGSRELLEALKARGVRCAVFTNKHGPSARTLMDHLGVAHLLDATFGAVDTPWFKPDREFTQHALLTLGADSATTCMIGDSPYDIQAAHNGGFPCHCVTTGTHSAKELTDARADSVHPDMTTLARKVFDLEITARI